MARSKPVTLAHGLTRSPPNRHNRLPLRVALSAAQARFQIEHGGIRRQPQSVEQRAGRDQHIVAAGDALDPHEVTWAKVLDPSGVEGHHRPNGNDLNALHFLGADGACATWGFRWQSHNER
jgi:hypothetical protein